MATYVDDILSLQIHEGAKEGMQAFHMVQQCLAKASQTIRVKGNAAQQKYITDMQRGHSVSRGSGNTPTGVPELLAILQHVLLQKRAQMERGNLTRDHGGTQQFVAESRQNGERSTLTPKQGRTQHIQIGPRSMQNVAN